MTISLTKKERKHLIEVINIVGPILHNFKDESKEHVKSLESVKQKLSKSKPAPEDWPADY